MSQYNKEKEIDFINKNKILLLGLNKFKSLTTNSTIDEFINRNKRYYLFI